MLQAQPEPARPAHRGRRHGRPCTSQNRRNIYAKASNRRTRNAWRGFWFFGSAPPAISKTAVWLEGEGDGEELLHTGRRAGSWGQALSAPVVSGILSLCTVAASGPRAVRALAVPS